MGRKCSADLSPLLFSPRMAIHLLAATIGGARATRATGLAAPLSSTVLAAEIPASTDSYTIDPPPHIFPQWHVGLHHLASLPARTPLLPPPVADRNTMHIRAAPLVRAIANGRPHGHMAAYLSAMTSFFGELAPIQQASEERAFGNSRSNGCRLVLAPAPHSPGRPRNRSRWDNTQGVALMKAATFNGTFNRFNPLGDAPPEYSSLHPRSLFHQRPRLPETGEASRT